jgi:hypothetical protein
MAGLGGKPFLQGLMPDILLFLNVGAKAPNPKDAAALKQLTQSIYMLLCIAALSYHPENSAAVPEPRFFSGKASGSPSY